MRVFPCARGPMRVCVHAHVCLPACSRLCVCLLETDRDRETESEYVYSSISVWECVPFLLISVTILTVFVGSPCWKTRVSIDYRFSSFCLFSRFLILCACFCFYVLLHVFFSVISNNPITILLQMLFVSWRTSSSFMSPITPLLNFLSFIALV